MVATLTATPNPAPVGSVVAVAGSGFSNRLTRILLDGVVYATDFRASKGAFLVGVQVAKTVKSQTLEAEQKQPGGNWSVVARLAPLLTFTPSVADTTAPVVTAQQLINITSSSVTVSWNTSEPSSSQVDWGLTTGYLGGPTTLDSALVTTHNVTVTGLTASTLYNFRVRSKDAADNEVVGTNMTTTTVAGGVTDTTAPVITNVLATVLGTTSARVSWSLDEPATGQVKYSLSSTLSSPLYSIKESSFTYSAHNQPLNSLTPGTTYYFVVISADASGNEATSSPVQTFTTTASVAVPVSMYGAGISMDSLANTRVGYGNQNTSYRFRAEQSSALNTIIVYIIANGNTGYSNGTGGTLRARLRADDGTANHRPTGSDLATASVVPGNPTGNNFPTFTFGSPYTVTAGQLYHLHFDNTDGAPTTNYVSLDACWVSNPQVPLNPKYLDTDFAQLFSEDTGSTWSVRDGFTPILDIGYANTLHQGVGYMEISYGAGEIGELDGPLEMIRNTFTVSGGSRTLTRVGIRLWRVSGSASVSCRLETSAGTEIETVTIPYTNFVTEASPPPADPPSGAGSWGSAAFVTPRVVANGSSYRIRFSTSSGSIYRTVPIRRGTHNYGFDNATVFADGISEKTIDGSAWTSLGRVASQNSLQWYFLTT